MMYYGYTIVELIVFGIAAIIVLWSLFKIIVEEKHASKFLYWFLLIVTIVGIWLWRSGNLLAFYLWAKLVIGTP